MKPIGWFIIGILLATTVFAAIDYFRPAQVAVNDTVLTDSVAILQDRIDSIESAKAKLLSNIEYRHSVDLQKQRTYYENQITHVKQLSADSSLSFFTAHTSRSGGHRRCDTD